MRWRGWMVPIVAAAALFTSPAAAVAATSADSVSGLEYAATSAQGRFAGSCPVSPGAPASAMPCTAFWATWVLVQPATAPAPLMPR